MDSIKYAIFNSFTQNIQCSSCSLAHSPDKRPPSPDPRLSLCRQAAWSTDEAVTQGRGKRLWRLADLRSDLLLLIGKHLNLSTSGSRSRHTYNSQSFGKKYMSARPGAQPGGHAGAWRGSGSGSGCPLEGSWVKCLLDDHAPRGGESQNYLIISDNIRGPGHLAGQCQTQVLPPGPHAPTDAHGPGRPQVRNLSLPWQKLIPLACESPNTHANPIITT